MAVTTVAAAGIAWWPAFTMGVYGAVFFQQLFALWVVSTTVFLVVVVSRPGRLRQRPAWWALMLPSMWLLLTLLLPSGGTSVVYDVLFWFGVAVTVVGVPVMAAVLVRLVVPGVERLDRHQAGLAIGVVALVMLASYVLGSLHPRVLSCDDFTISGNFAPPGCTPGEATTTREARGTQHREQR